MRRMIKWNKKTGLILVIYSMVITIIFVVGILIYLRTFNNNQYNVLPNNLVDLGSINYRTINELKNTNDIYADFTKDDTTKYATAKDSIISRDQIENYYASKLYSNLPVLMITICILTIVFTWILWIILKKIEKEEVLTIARGLVNIEGKEYNIENLDPVLVEVYNGLKEKFNNHIEDYKRLHSYISHEQKNAIAILKTKLEINGDKELLKNLDYITDSIEDILTVSESNEVDGMANIDVALICAEVIDQYKKVYNDISFDFDEDGNTNIYAKERWIYRAIANLLDNAIKYGENKPIEVSVYNKNNSVIITVKDNGIGMSEDKLNKIFDNRYRVNRLNKDGYGIGLSLVSHVCDLCDGYVWVDSNLGKGSVFYLAFRAC
ncbi:sensor histidine kinase [Clostridium sardiniense]|uniref:sensor histidine kinase n=1 Tax=Clostridium sardiniense TaxID=29369 RepID=UPI003D32FBC1